MKKIFILLIALFLITSCGNSDSTVATVGKTKITKGEFEFYLASIKSQLSSTELKTDEDWQMQEIEGEKAIDVAKRRALEIAVNNAAYCEVAKAQGLELSEAEKADVADTKNRVISSYGGEAAYKSFLDKNNITDSFIQMMCESTVYYSKIADKVNAEMPITEEDSQNYFESEKNALSAEYRKAKHILIPTQDLQTGLDLSEEEKAQSKEFADSLYNRIQAGEDFDALMHKYSQDTGLQTYPDGYVFSSGEMVPEFEQAVDSVSEGEITICKSTYGYHIIKRLPIEYADIKDKIDETILKDRIDRKMQEWEKEYGITVTTNDGVIKSIK